MNGKLFASPSRELLSFFGAHARCCTLVDTELAPDKEGEGAQKGLIGHTSTLADWREERSVDSGRATVAQQPLVGQRRRSQTDRECVSGHCLQFETMHESL